MLKFRYETSTIGYESQKCTQAAQGGLLGEGGGCKSTPSKHKLFLFPPACSSQLITEDLPGSLAGWYMRMDIGQPLTSQSVRYHSLAGTIIFRLTACYKLGQATWYVGSTVYVCWSVFATLPTLEPTLLSYQIGCHTLQ